MDAILSKPIELAPLRAALGLDQVHVMAPAPLPAPPSTAPEPQSEAALDPNALRRAAGELTQDQARELINLFIASARRELWEANRRLAAGEREALALIMHKLKSSAGAVGAARFASRALALEQAARDQTVDDLGPRLATLDVEVEAVEAAARQLVGVIESHGEELSPLGSALAPADQDFSAEELQEALNRDEFLVHFQPKLTLATGKVAGIEALARWRRGGGTLPAQRFIPAALRHDLIQPLSELLAAKALLAANELERAGLRQPLSLNLAAPWLDNPRLPDFLLATRRAVGAEGCNILLEVDLSDLPEDPANAPATLGRLRGQGFTLSLCRPCAATSLASLAARLPRYMAGELKLGTSLLRQAGDDPTVRARLGALLSSARAGGLSLVAEGVESQSDLDLARSLGCDLAQGWFIAGAMPLEQLLAWLRGRRTE
jgi:EAL domain-containing protein (putative c-di-GMP-specific phosphodiesterase class I)